MIHFREIAAHYGIGSLLSAPSPVLGGLLHTTYRLDAEEGSFALKILNPAVMKRPEAMDNMIRSEAIARAMAEVVPAVAAVVKDSSPVSLIGGEYVMLYPWLACRPIFPPKLNARHAAAVGDVLGKMHEAGAALFSSGTIPPAPASSEPIERDWAKIADEAARSCPGASWLDPLRDAVPLLDELEVKSRAARLLPSVFSHRDLDPKNVLWEGPAPRIIDWESAGETDPASELTDVLLAWADKGAGGEDEALFRALLDAYRAVRSVEDEDWDAVFDASFRGPLDWLAYNIRRASGEEDDDHGDRAHDRSHARMVGASEVSGTLRALTARIPALDAARKWMGV